MKINSKVLPVLLALIALTTSCEKEEVLQNSLDFSTPYVITDNPADPVQHHRYEIYRKYGVPVFFNDTVSSTLIGKNQWGDDIYRYETLDFNWSFSSHNKESVTYYYQLITDPVIQEQALKFVDEFLEQASEPMRPFSIFLPGSFIIRSNKGIEHPDYWTGFRTLVIPDVQVIPPERIKEFTQSVLMAMVKDRVLNNNDVVDAFGSVSSANKYYNKRWVNELGCKWGVEHKGTYWNPSRLWKPGVAEEYVYWAYNTGVSTVEEFEAERALIFEQIGQFGFISGNDKESVGHLLSPKDVNEDLSYYVDCIVALGSEGFVNRYGSSPMVQQKYEIVADYIRNTLLIDF